MKNQKINFEFLKTGFERYFAEHGHYPMVHEIDECSYLPSSRQIQRLFKGGVRELRQLLGIEITDHTVGAARSDMAKEIGRRGKNQEISIQKILIDKFGEMYVHEQKPFPDYSGRFDFFVYSRSLKFAIDVFYATDKRSFTGCLNNKIHIYKSINFKVFLLQTNEHLFEQFNLLEFIGKKKNTIPDHIVLISLNEFRSLLDSLEPIITGNSLQDLN